MSDPKLYAAKTSKGSVISGKEEYDAMYKQSVEDPDKFWGEMARKSLSWFRDFENVKGGRLEDGSVSWFSGGRLNVCYNCVDRHLPERAGQTALLWEGDKPEQVRRVTYQELHDDVCRIANALRRHGVRRGDRVVLYMPMVPETVASMLACARIGAVHVVVFAGFSAEALRSRINDAGARVVMTADAFTRGGKLIGLKALAEEALLGCPQVQTVFVHKFQGVRVPVHPQRDVDLLEEMRRERPVCPVEELDSEDPLFVLHTSGSTGKPKGLLHTQAGYLLYAMTTTRYAFDLRDGDVYACVADIGWITGHSYIVYGPLANGATSMVFMGLPTSPSPSRYWDMVQRHGITQLYTSPTAVRTLMVSGDAPLDGYDLNTLRVIGVVGEPINPKAWEWLYHTVGKDRASIVDTYWQTETGGHVLLSLPHACPMRPGAAAFPFFGIKPVLVDPETAKPLPETPGQEATGRLCISAPWPGMARTVVGDHERYLQTYMAPFAGHYFTGDGAVRDKDGLLWITGRVDDVINKAGHRLGSAEIESALVAHPACAEAACIAVPDEVRGEAVAAYVILSDGYESVSEKDMTVQLRDSVRKHIGGLAVPDIVIFSTALPKTRSGKIMRRLLRKLLDGSFSGDISILGDISTLADPKAFEDLAKKVELYLNQNKS